MKNHTLKRRRGGQVYSRELETLVQGRIQELKGGGAEVKYLQRENFTLRHSYFGVIWL